MRVSSAAHTQCRYPLHSGVPTCASLCVAPRAGSCCPGHSSDGRRWQCPRISPPLSPPSLVVAPSAQPLARLRMRQASSAAARGAALSERWREREEVPWWAGHRVAWTALASPPTTAHLRMWVAETAMRAKAWPCLRLRSHGAPPACKRA